MPFHISRYALSSCVAAVMLSSCGGSQPPIGAPGAMQQNRAIAPAYTSADRIASGSPEYRVLYNFNGKDLDGVDPYGALIDVNGTLYGTTYNGGTYGHGTSEGGEGTVFSITRTGAEKVLHSFGKGSDGSLPLAGLTDVSGTLYGTTSSGGTSGHGTVFSISTAGEEHIFYSFRGRPHHDGDAPAASLIDVNGTLYGTTQNGGKYGSLHHKGRSGDGTVFSITTSGTESVLHSFDSSNGRSPSASLIDVNGTLYGTTYEGGPYCTGSGAFDDGCGAIFSITLAGKEHVLHYFGSGSDGKHPNGLLDVKGTLYGTTFAGGQCNASTYGCGTVYSISPDGTSYQVLYNFGEPPDGYAPSEGSLIDVKGTLYGTTLAGGKYSNIGAGYGTIFSITTTGTEHVLHSFGKGYDGHYPNGLLDVHGTLYGTTLIGGKYCYSGCGTVFALRP